MALFKGVLCTFNIVTLPLITFYHIFGRHRTPSARPSLLMFRADRPIVRISSSLVLYRIPRSGSYSTTFVQRSGENETLRGTEPHYSSFQCKESHRCCCHGHLAPLTMGDSVTSILFTRYESMRLRSLRQIERTTVRNPIQHKR